MTLEITVIDRLILTIALENHIKDQEHWLKQWTKENAEDPRVPMIAESIWLTKTLLDKVKSAV
jgi:hypothetical protein